jgi:hypothetical protein
MIARLFGFVLFLILLVVALVVGFGLGLYLNGTPLGDQILSFFHLGP